MEKRKILSDDIEENMRRKEISETNKDQMTGYASIDRPWLKYYDISAIESETPKGKSMYSYIHWNSANSDRIAIRYHGKIITYNELFKKIGEFASRFKEMGVKKDDIVTICMPNTPEAVYSAYAVNELGAVCDFIDPRSNPEQLEYYLSQNKSKHLILCDNFYKTLKPAVDKADLNETILMPVSASMPLPLKLIVESKIKKVNKGLEYGDKIISFKDFLKIKKNNIIFAERSSNDLAVIIHSSGTTSVPKGIMLSNENVNAIAHQYKQTSLGIAPGDKFLAFIPIFASFGISTSFNLPFSCEMQNYMLALTTPEKFVKMVDKHKPEFTLTIPANFVNYARHGKAKDLSFFKGPGCGGYTLDSTHEKGVNDYFEAHKAKVPMLTGWGMSELSATATLETKECARPLSSGIPLVKNTVAIFKPGTEEELKYGEEGEICVNGPTIMMGYLNNPEKTAQVIKTHKDGVTWLHSGDIGYMDSDGCLYHVDRAERMIIKGVDGFKIFPQKIEEVISQSKYISNCAVVSANGEYGVYPRGFLELKEEYYGHESEALADVKRICSEKLSERAIPENFIFAEIPFTKMGKPDFKALENYDEKPIERVRK